MPIDVYMPGLSPTMEEGTVVKWHKKEGDKVKQGEVIAVIQTDKSAVDFEAEADGILGKIHVGEGVSVPVNEPIAVITSVGEVLPSDYKPKRVITTDPTKTENKSAEKTDDSKEPSQSKVAPSTGSMQSPAFVPEKPLESSQFPFTSSGHTKASPLARKLAKQQGLDLSSVKGTGPNGRISSRDLSSAVTGGAVSFARRSDPQENAGAYEEVALSPMRKLIGTRLQQSKTFIPHFYVRQEINADALFDAREQLKLGGLKVTYNDFIVRACALALKEHPNVNSGFNSVSQSLIRFKTVDISIAVSIPDGLITPILRQADYMNLGEISVQVKDLANRAKEGTLKPHEYKGGSFTISNLGMYGVSDFVAIINPPQSAILAVSGIEECVRFKHDAAVPGKKMNLTLSADHRVIDGADAAKFMKTVQKYLENPAVLLV
jgi:pyruvate dehydrogenase E2 component (dihydrolipoamide acetyltransferase)